MTPRPRTHLKDHNSFLYQDVPSPLPSNGMLPIPTHEEADKQMEHFKELSTASGRKIKTEDLEEETVDAIMTVWGRLCPKIKLQKRSHVIMK